ncbi:DUF692 family multinuclear iron-containing protein [Pleurocapsa sp. PCC 7319]|uniref:multinuclear nonheme iron-dependent oxidase n=1 Tax=Pleurocapsa sp. PCC 7319 TaxID=118161 RepID=UPI00192AB2B6|nr:DUF692 family multinuclear iron-containing protein [Pleurocapsa sp. PCC 7319]
MGLDMPWSRYSKGFRFNSDAGDSISDELKHFFNLYRQDFNYIFLAFQPRGRSLLHAEDYFAAYDQFFSTFEHGHQRVRALHHTLLNLGSIEHYDKAQIVEFTNLLINRYQFMWIVEDLGIWSLHGKSLPYPLPPFLTQDGLNSCIENVKTYQNELHVPLCVEFPGFTEGNSFYIGDLDAFDFFAEVSRATGCPVTIDVGHILSYQWLHGRYGKRQIEGLERLPLDHCFELHLSGCSIVNGKFRDLHNGILMDEQLEVLEYLLDNCPNLKAVTYEDPRFTRDGYIIPRAQKNYEILKMTVADWAETL